MAIALPFALVAPAGAAQAKDARTRDARAGSALAATIGAPASADDYIPGVALPASPVSGSLNEVTDWDDVYSVYLRAGDTLNLSLNGAGGTDYDLYLFAPGATDTYEDAPVALSENSSYPETISYVAPAPGTYYVDVCQFEGSASYTLTWSIDRFIPAGAADVYRFGGANRYAVAETAARASFELTKVTDVIIASGADQAMADPLSAAGLAGAYGAPLLLVGPALSGGKVVSNTENTIAAIKAANGGRVNIHVVGGTAWIPATVYNRLSALKGPGGTIERIAGANRYAVSANMAARADQVLRSKGATNGVPFVMVAAGDNPAAFYDALAASPVSYANAAPTLLVRGTAVPAEVAAALKTTFAGKTRYAVNSTTYLSSGVYTATGASARLTASSNRFVAATNIAQFAYDNGLLDLPTVGVANKLPDALTGGVAMGNMRAAILYTDAASLSTTTSGFINSHNLDYTTVCLFGGLASLSDMTAWDVVYATAD